METTARATPHPEGTHRSITHRRDRRTTSDDADAGTTGDTTCTDLADAETTSDTTPTHPINVKAGGGDSSVSNTGPATPAPTGITHHISRPEEPTNEGQGSREGPAAEPAPLPFPTPPYDPRRFQLPHPSERGSAGGGEGEGVGVGGVFGRGRTVHIKPSSGAKGLKVTQGSGAPGKTKTATPLDPCAWCAKPGATMRCAQCRSQVYCGEQCQGVSIEDGV